MIDEVSESIPKEFFEIPSEKEIPPPVKRGGISFIADSIGKHPEWMYVPGGILVCGILVAKRKKIFQSNAQSGESADGSITQSEESISEADSNRSLNLSSKKSSLSTSPSAMPPPSLKPTHSPLPAPSPRGEPSRTTSTQQPTLQTNPRQPRKSSAPPAALRVRRYSLPTPRNTTQKASPHSPRLVAPLPQRPMPTQQEHSRSRSPSLPTTPKPKQNPELDVKPPTIVFLPSTQLQAHVTHFATPPSEELSASKSFSPNPLPTNASYSLSGISSQAITSLSSSPHVNGMHPSELHSQAKAKKPSFQDLICDGTKQGIIRTIVETLHATNALAMAGKAAYLTEIGNQINDVHTLCFLWTIFKDPGLKEKLTFIFNSFWWKPQKMGFMSGVNGVNGMTRYTVKTLDPYLEEWAQQLGTTKQAVAPLIEKGFKKSDWEELVTHLIKTPSRK